MNPFDAQQLAKRLMNEHGLGCQWGFRFDNAKRRFGSCNYVEKAITLSEPLTWLNDEAEVRNVILHEIAHARAGNAAGHGPVWKAHARAIGCTATRCYGEHVVTPPKAFTGTCPSCGKVIHRHRRMNISCGKCCPIYKPEYAFIWTRS